MSASTCLWRLFTKCHAGDSCLSALQCGWRPLRACEPVRNCAQGNVHARLRVAPERGHGLIDWRMATPHASAPRSLYAHTAQAQRQRALIARATRRVSACAAAQDELAASVPEHEARLSGELALAERHVAALRALVPLRARCLALRSDDLPAAEARGAALQAEADALGAGAAEARDSAGRADRDLVVRAACSPCCTIRVCQTLDETQ